MSELAPGFPGLAEAIAALRCSAGGSFRAEPAPAEGEALEHDGFESLDDVIAEVTALDVLSDPHPPESTTAEADVAPETTPTAADREAPAAPRKRRKKITFV